MAVVKAVMAKTQKLLMVHQVRVVTLEQVEQRIRGSKGSHSTYAAAGEWVAN